MRAALRWLTMSSPSRPVLIAPDKFKGTLSAEQVARAIADGLDRGGLVGDVCRVADGGEGTVDAISASLQVQATELTVEDASGLPVSARLLELGEGVLLAQSCDAIGLGDASPNSRDAVAASSRGVGQLIAAAADAGARRLMLGIGGTATTDGGAGAIEVLRETRLVGVRGPLKRCPKVTALCDVRAAWEQAAPVFAPQKGASTAATAELAARLDALALVLPKDPRGKLMTGAGGGLAGGLWAAADAELKSGAAWVLAQFGFDQRMLAARAVITGEGRLDRQTLLGKSVGEVATRARQAGVPCHAIVGTMAMTAFDARILDFESVQEASSAAAITTAAEQLVPLLPSR